MKTKCCSKCKNIFPLTGFPKCKTGTHGRFAYCRLCLQIVNKTAKEKNKQKNSKNAKQYYRTPKGRFLYSKARAKRRGITWTLSEKEFYSLIAKNCQYCQASPIMQTGSGLDRFDNSKGYTKENAVPCCAICNRMFMHHDKEFAYVHMQKMLDVRSKT